MKFKDLEKFVTVCRMIHLMFEGQDHEEDDVQIEQTSTYSYVVDIIAEDELYNATVYINFTKTTAQCYISPFDKMCDASTWTFNLSDMSYSFTYDD